MKVEIDLEFMEDDYLKPVSRFDKNCELSLRNYGCPSCDFNNYRMDDCGDAQETPYDYEE